jgi:2-polyprenyl-6-methoxyphenol hydroxylase-like FAD-dependent oxidoreductase
VVRADVHKGVRDVRLETGKRKLVRWTEKDGGKCEAHCRLVVGADGRRSSVRSQARIELEVDPPAHLVAGMLVDNVEGMDDEVNVMAREADLIFYSFPQQAGSSRLYLCFRTGQEPASPARTDRSVSWIRAGSTALLTWLIGQRRVRQGHARRFPGKTAVCHVRSWMESF